MTMKVVRGLPSLPGSDETPGLIAQRRTSKLNAKCDVANQRAPPPSSAISHVTRTKARGVVSESPSGDAPIVRRDRLGGVVHEYAQAA